MTDEEYKELVRTAVLKWSVIVPVLRKRHPKADAATIDDAIEGAMIEFSDRENILAIHHPEKPLGWLIATSEHFLSHEAREHSREMRLSDVTQEPDAYDTFAKELNTNETLRAVLAELSNVESELIKMHALDKVPLTEIANLQGRTESAVYHSFERAMKKAHEIARKDGLCEYFQEFIKFFGEFLPPNGTLS